MDSSVPKLKDIIQKSQDPSFSKAPTSIRQDMRTGKYLESMKSQAIKVIMLKKCKSEKHTRQRQTDIMKIENADSIA